MIYTKKLKYNAEFCSLIGANSNINYTKTIIYNLLISHAKTYHKYFEFNSNPKLKEFLHKIIPINWNGYRKSDLMNILNLLIIPKYETLESKYVIISSDKSNILIKELNIIL